MPRNEAWRAASTTFAQPESGDIRRRFAAQVGAIGNELMVAKIGHVVPQAEFEFRSDFGGPSSKPRTAFLQ
jgi:hypothetical protein